ncbi:branched-chain amino acid aminotransferase [Micrococcus sp.]|uniref:branched-chain amino acid aminotransferase n=1 Tax=Micrococcus sp. TaxID=1271 RepID=UPI002A9146E9|nr:branched-chain amino acid aminotransferase [Micrococcus sp.]MDY6055684.1 branched-chain amino acid aminotransferase [Micrococcus sp.]
MNTPTFARQPHLSPLADEKRAEILENPGFGDAFTDHMVSIDWTWSEDGGTWHDARVEPYGPLTLDPATSVLHYAQEIFEGLKAYRHADGSVWTFRPEVNAARLNRSARRLALPELPEELFLGSLEALVEADKDWVPSGDGQSLYLRPFMIATEAFLGVRPAKEVRYMVIASPAGNYFGGELKPVTIWVSREYARAGRGGTGAAKCGGNYAASMLPQLQAAAQGANQVVFLDHEREDAIEELGGMNVFFVFKDGRLVTPELTGTILEGVTRSSILQLGRDMGLTVEERRVTLAEWAEGVRSGEITEVFACGTAAVVTPIGRLLDGDDVIESAGGTDVTLRIRAELEGIQTGKVEDRHGWLHRLA